MWRVFIARSLKTSVVDSLNDVAGVSCSYRVGLDDSECKIPKLIALPIVSISEL